jgi:glycosyltransferase involved in cell wall biosynthesis
MEFSPATAYYFERFGFCPRQIWTGPNADVGIVVVIPAYNEDKLVKALGSLWECERPKCAVEVIVVVNCSEVASQDVREQNARTIEEARAWANNHENEGFRTFVLDFQNLPPKKAGVGLARKIGMDEALGRFDLAHNIEGVIACFDADCLCDRNYLAELESFFTAAPEATGCSIYMEHPLEGPGEKRVYEAVSAYELHLRYYVQGLRFAGYPFAFHTIGSSMAVRASIYRKQGGMNKKQAGEDFYFLHKVIPLGGFGDVTTTRIIASPRPSNRVPFGTGRAVNDYLMEEKRETYPLEAFLELKEFLSRLKEIESGAFHWGEHGGRSLGRFLEKNGFEGAIRDARKHTRTASALLARFYWWLDGFRVMKFIHFARDTVYGTREVGAEAGKLFEMICPDEQWRSVSDLLLKYRAIERQRPWPPARVP